MATPSLCAGWGVRTVAAHLAAPLTLSWAPWLAAVMYQAGNVHRANDAVAQQAARRPVAELVELLRGTSTAGLHRRWSGPGGR